MMRTTLALLLIACKSGDNAPRDTIGTGDHDGDGLADGADNCPAHFNETQADGDGDGVGDICDPHVAQPGDKLISASLFSTGFGDWSPASVADWAAAEGVITTTADADATNTRLTTGTSAPTPTLLVGLSVLAYGPTVGTFGENRIILTLTLDNAETWACTTFNDSMVDVRLSHVLMNANGAYNKFRSLTTLVEAGARIQAAVAREAATAICRTEDGVLPEPTTSITPHATSASIQVIGARMSLSYALIYGVP